MRLIDADALIGALHNHTFIEGDDRSICYNVIHKQPTIESEIMDDLISRREAIDALREEFKKSPTTAIRAMSAIKILPSAQPEHTMEEFMYGQNMGNPEDGSL